MASTERSSELTLTNSQYPGFGLIEKATWGGTTIASCKFQPQNINIKILKEKKMACEEVYA